MKEITKKFDLSTYFGDAESEETTSTASSIIFFLIAAMLVFSVIAFGAVDAWALGMLSIFTSLIAVLWLTDAFQKKELRFNSSSLQIPLLGLILIGLIQLLPLRSFDNSGNLLAVSAVNSISLEAYS